MILVIFHFKLKSTISVEAVVCNYILLRDDLKELIVDMSFSVTFCLDRICLNPCMTMVNFDYDIFFEKNRYTRQVSTNWLYNLQSACTCSHPTWASICSWI